LPLQRPGMQPALLRFRHSHDRSGCSDYKWRSRQRRSVWTGTLGRRHERACGPPTGGTQGSRMVSRLFRELEPGRELAASAGRAPTRGMTRSGWNRISERSTCRFEVMRTSLNESRLRAYGASARQPSRRTSRPISFAGSPSRGVESARRPLGYRVRSAAQSRRHPRGDAIGTQKPILVGNSCGRDILATLDCNIESLEPPHLSDAAEDPTLTMCRTTGTAIRLAASQQTTRGDEEAIL
jgi:hypothetical protein